MLNKITNSLKSRNGILISRVVITLIFFISVSLYMFSDPGGISGYSYAGCTCHNSQNNATSITLTAESGSFTVNAGSTQVYTVTLSNSTKNYWGVDIGVKTTQTGETNAGSFSNLGTGLRTLNNELTQSSPKNGTGGTTFTFSWTAPTTPGTYYMRVAGNGVNRDGGINGDAWNTITPQAITVVSTASLTLTSPIGGENLCPGGQTNITWTSANITNVKIEVSTDGGSNFGTTLVSSTPASTGSWTWNISSAFQAGTTYKIRISDASNLGTNSISAANFSMVGPASISTHPQAVTVCAGQQASFSVTTSGSVQSYKWRLNGNDLPNSNSATYTINNTAAANAGTYSCVVTGSCNTVTSNSATLIVDELPNITSQPANQKICAGQTASFAITATGTNISYSWRKNGTPIQGANSATFTINGITTDDAGNYDCEVTGKCQPPKTSNTAVLTVDAAPSITQQPKVTSECEGANTFLFVSATGAGLTYSWIKDGNPIASSNNDTLYLKNLKTTDQGFYAVKITGTCTPDITSQAVTLTVNPKPTITVQPLDQTLTENQNLTLSVKATGSGLKYAWKKDGTVLPGKDSATLVINKVKKTDAGTYTCTVSNACSSLVSHDAKVVVNSAGAGPILSLSVANVDFGFVEKDFKKDSSLTAIISNSGDQPLTISAVNVTGTDASLFRFSGFVIPQTIQPGASTGIIISFNPTATGLKNASIEFTANSTTTPKLNVEGTGYLYDLKANPGSLTIFAPIGQSGENSVKLTNNSSMDLNISGSISGADAADFSFRDNNSNFTIAMNETKDIFIKFTPSQAGSRNANLTFNVVDLGKNLSTQLLGTTVNSVEVSGNMPQVQIYPNPINQRTIIRFNVELSINDRINIVNENGVIVKNLNVNDLSSGQYEWDGKDASGNQVADGMYRLQIVGEGSSKSYPIIILK